MDQACEWAGPWAAGRQSVGGFAGELGGWGERAMGGTKDPGRVWVGPWAVWIRAPHLSGHSHYELRQVAPLPDVHLMHHVCEGLPTQGQPFQHPGLIAAAHSGTLT